jgi:hypothetical protein
VPHYIRLSARFSACRTPSSALLSSLLETYVQAVSSSSFIERSPLTPPHLANIYPSSVYSRLGSEPLHRLIRPDHGLLGLLWWADAQRLSCPLLSAASCYMILTRYPADLLNPSLPDPPRYRLLRSLRDSVDGQVLPARFQPQFVPFLPPLFFSHIQLFIHTPKILTDRSLPLLTASSALMASITGLLALLIVTIIFVPFNGFVISRKWGAFLIFFYTCSMVSPSLLKPAPEIEKEREREREREREKNFGLIAACFFFGRFVIYAPRSISRNDDAMC